MYLTEESWERVPRVPYDLDQQLHVAQKMPHICEDLVSNE